MFLNKFYVYPIILAIYVPTGFIITYTIAVCLGHVYPLFPFISDTGTHSPESCVFAQLLNIGAVLAAFVIHIRYKQIQTVYEGSGRPTLLKVNFAAWILGLLCALGVSIVGNFQETNVLEVHLIGAFLAFLVGTVYCTVQTGMSFRMSDVPGTSPIITKVRVALTVLEYVFIVILTVSVQIAQSEQDADVDRFQWDADDPGYAPHLVSTFSEWIIAVLIVVFFLTYVSEFKHFRVKSYEILFHTAPHQNGLECSSTASHRSGSVSTTTALPK